MKHWVIAAEKTNILTEESDKDDDEGLNRRD